MFGMMYSGKIDTFEGVITVTSMSYDRHHQSDKQDEKSETDELTTCIRVRRAANLTNAESS